MSEWGDTVAAGGWPLLGAVQLASNTGLQADTWVRKLEDELRLEEDIQVFNSLLG